jgi:hypothetical protein
MIYFAQRKPEKLQKSIFHHALIKLIVLEQLKKEGKNWPTFLFVSNYHIDLPPSPPKHRASKKKIATSPIDSYVPSSKIPPHVDPPTLPFEVALDFFPSAPTPETKHPSSSTIPHASENHQSSQKPIYSKPSLAQVYRRKRKEMAQETVIEEQAEPLVELPQMDIEDNSPIIQSTVDTPVLRISSRRKLVLSEEFVPSSEMVEPSDKLSKFKASPLEKEALEAIV